MERENRFLEEEEDDDEDYIDMDISSITTPPKSLEFEFRLPTTISDQEESISISPADELFYRGKLLPLHLPPRLEMVEKISLLKGEEEKIVVTQVNDRKDRIPWSKRLKHMSKASRAYIKSMFFFKSASSDEEKETIDGSSKEGKKNHLFWQIRGVHVGKEGRNVLKQEAATFKHRSSFSGAIHHKIRETKRLCPSPFSSSSSSCSCSCCSSSSSSCSSSDTIRLMPMLQRSNSMNSEGEISIQGAITYCKNSMDPGRKSESDLLQCSISVSRITAACESIDKKPGICRG